jgi:hypothetical protein
MSDGRATKSGYGGVPQIQHPYARVRARRGVEWSCSMFRPLPELAWDHPANPEHVDIAPEFG